MTATTLYQVFEQIGPDQWVGVSVAESEEEANQQLIKLRGTSTKNYSVQPLSIVPTPDDAAEPGEFVDPFSVDNP